MEFKVKLTRNAKHEIDLAYLWLKQHTALCARITDNKKEEK